MSGRVVISSLTGRPIPWEDPEDHAGPAGAAARGEEPKVLPDRVREDAAEPGADESNDSRLARDRPPHWGTGA